MLTQFEEEFLEYMHYKRQASKNTISSYRHDIEVYIDYLIKRGTDDITSVTKSAILTYLLYLRKEGKSVSTIKRNLASIRSFYKYLCDMDIIKANPTLGLETPRNEKKIPVILSADEVELLLNQPKGTDAKALRDKAMLEVLYATGMRVSELIMLDISDVNVISGHIHLEGKNKRKLPLGRIAVRCLAQYLEKARPSMIRNAGQTALFVNCYGERITRQGFWKIVRYYKESANIETSITPHTLRHSFAAHMIQSGADAKVVSKLLGHADVSSILIYTNMNSDDLSDVYKNNHPRA